MSTDAGDEVTLWACRAADLLSEADDALDGAEFAELVDRLARMCVAVILEREGFAPPARDERSSAARHDAADARLRESGVAVGSRWRHRRTNGEVRVVALALVEADLGPCVVYAHDDPYYGTVPVAARVAWVRPLAEFCDGRFTEITVDPDDAEGDAAAEGGVAPPGAGTGGPGAGAGGPGCRAIRASFAEERAGFWADPGQTLIVTGRADGTVEVIESEGYVPLTWAERLFMAAAVMGLAGLVFSVGVLVGRG